MKNRSYFIAILFLSASLFGTSVNAHDPTAIWVSWVSYGGGIKQLNHIQVDHEVEDPTTHYINLIEIYRNKSLEISKTYTNQTNTEYQYDDTIDFSTTEYDRIKFIAYCNQGGKMVFEDWEKTDALSILPVSLTIISLVIVIRRRRRH